MENRNGDFMGFFMVEWDWGWFPAGIGTGISLVEGDLDVSYGSKPGKSVREMGGFTPDNLVRL